MSEEVTLPLGVVRRLVLRMRCFGGGGSSASYERVCEGITRPVRGRESTGGGTADGPLIEPRAPFAPPPPLQPTSPQEKGRQQSVQEKQPQESVQQQLRHEQQQEQHAQQRHSRAAETLGPKRKLNEGLLDQAFEEVLLDTQQSCHTHDKFEDVFAIISHEGHSSGARTTRYIQPDEYTSLPDVFYRPSMFRNSTLKAFSPASSGNAIRPSPPSKEQRPALGRSASLGAAVRRNMTSVLQRVTSAAVRDTGAPVCHPAEARMTAGATLVPGGGNTSASGGGKAAHDVSNSQGCSAAVRLSKSKACSSHVRQDNSLLSPFMLGAIKSEGACVQPDVGDNAPPPPPVMLSSVGHAGLPRARGSAAAVLCRAAHQLTASTSNNARTSGHLGMTSQPKRNACGCGSCSARTSAHGEAGRALLASLSSSARPRARRHPSEEARRSSCVRQHCHQPRTEAAAACSTAELMLKSAEFFQQADRGGRPGSTPRLSSSQAHEPHSAHARVPLPVLPMRTPNAAVADFLQNKLQEMGYAVRVGNSAAGLA
uniref:Uncharacterized protein n=1 Tax=Chlamydomonas euryale TaxID=1486919 RepID=A0A7R9VV18_9CHLO|mmetsp:Transcript_5040/g.15300  ORF Transcript_5040/g.15300 Transcript_5040/m.15300 type:complete len:540 (+) Transcript_5040:592-2211(+)